ncbi:MAG: nuclear transport factor 2 family protein [Melioribacter sp.]|jgi:ketosteroid isomerase-like protein|uniref:YybH family protein n=1 Tax=Rosettibacter primus TaxID=3111523 RepID=UPI00247BA66C|nr:nuclear transport factor 2 family protein [Melioribacter sp.]
MDRDTKEIESVIDYWVKSIQQKNMEGILQNHSPDILMFDVPVPLQSKGLKEYRKTWKLFFQYSSEGKNSFQLEEFQITTSDTVAFCTALIKLSNSPKPQCRLTIGLKKINNQWMIVHEHHSAPHELSE